MKESSHVLCTSFIVKTRAFKFLMYFSKTFELTILVALILMSMLLLHRVGKKYKVNYVYCHMVY